MTARTGFDTLAPEFGVKIGGSPLPNAAVADLIRLQVVDDVDAPGMFGITIVAWDTAEMKAKWVDEALVAEGNPVEIAFGYRDQTQPLISGEITGLEMDCPESAPPTLTIRGYDRRHRLMRARRTRTFTQCSDSDIAKQIASEAGLSPDVEASNVVLPHVFQHNQTDLEFLQGRARRIGFELLVRERKLLFRPRPMDRSPALTLHREVEIISLSLRMSTLGQAPKLEVRGWDPATKEAIVAEAGAGDERKVMGDRSSGATATDNAFSPPVTARVTEPVSSADEAQAIARGGFGEASLGFVRADAQCIGDPRLSAGMIVELAGLGTRFSGPYYLTSVEHSFAPGKGYRTRFSARRNAA